MSSTKICPTCGTEYPLSERFCPRDGTALRSQDAAADLVGSVIAERYHVIRKLGEGGMGAVYLAEHVKMGRKSAIKVMNPGMSHDPDAIARFNREAANASRMNHPNICAIYDFGETVDGLIYLAMEFIEGTSLTSVIQELGAVPPARAASILHQAADALQVAHDYGIVHRDLKPDNIMIARGRDGGDLVKVVDFGIAKAHTSDAQKVTRTGLVVGTPEYMSPEQLAGDKLDGRSDIYSLALVGFNMLTGKLPFPAQTAQEAMIMRLTDDPRTLVEMKPDVAWPPALQSVLTKALARDAAERYQRASDFGREFAAAIAAMPDVSLTEAGTIVIGANAATPAAAIPRTRVASDSERDSAPSAPAARRSVVPLVGGAAVAITAIAVAFVMSLGPDGGTGPAGGDTGVTAPTGPAAPTGQGGGPPQNDGSASGAGGRTSRPPQDAGGATGPTGSTAVGSQPPPAVLNWEDSLARIDTLISAEDANQAVRMATRLMGAADTERRSQLLYRRAQAYLQAGDNTRGCADLDDALRIATGARFIQGINTLRAFGECGTDGATLVDPASFGVP